MTRRSNRFALVLAFATSSTVATAQPPTSPDVTPEAAARTVALEGAPASNEVVAGGLTADEAAARAVATAPSLARANAVVRIAEAGAMQAFSGVLPRLSLTARATYTNNIVNNLATATPDQLAQALATADLVQDPLAGQLFRQIFLSSSGLRFPYFRSQYELSAQLAYPVTTSLLTALPLYRAAGLNVDAARVQRDADLALIALRAREAFYEHVRARGALVVATDARDALRGHREQVNALVDAGVAARADLLQVEAQLASAEVAVQNATLGVDISARALGILIAGDDEEIPTIQIGEDVTTTVALPNGSIVELEARALEQRAEMVAINTSRQAHQLEARAHAAARYPQLSVVGNVQYMNPNTRYIPQTRSFRSSWDVSAVLTWSPNDMLTSEGRRRVALAQLDELDSQELALRDAVRLEVTQAYQSLLSTRATMESARAAVTAAEEAYRVRTEQLAQGVIVSTELADARIALTRARLELVDSSIQMRIARARMDRALGEGTPTP